MATVILIWAFWNNAGVPGDALFLLGRTIFQRVILPVIALFVVFGLFSSRLWSLALFFVALVLAFVIGANDGAAMAAAFLVLIAGALLLARFGVVADASEIVRTGAVTVACFVAIAVALATSGTFIGAVCNTTIVSTFCGAVAGCVGVVVAVLYAQAKRLGHRSIFLSLFIVTMIVLAYVFAARASPLASPDAWKRGGAFLLLFGLLTLLNAPFDFLSLGLTRGFLRRGLQERGFSPIKFAFYDAAVAIAIIGVLACVLVIAIQFFGALEMPGGLPHPTLNLQGALDTIEHDPWAPQNFWIYALLLTTQAPSLINLSIGAVSVAWTFRPFSTLILSGFPKTKGGRVVKADRNWMIPLLISRWFLPAVMGFIGGIFILFAIFHWLLPMIYFDIGSIVEWLVNRDFPAHLLGT